MMQSIYKAIAGMIPKSYKKKLEVLLSYAGIDEDVSSWLGSRLFISLIIALLGASIPYILESLKLLPTDIEAKNLSLTFAVIFFLTSLIFSYMHLYYTIEERRKRVETILPDFLLLVAANMRAGMTPISAFTASSRPEFGPLEDEIKIATSKSLGTESIVNVFNDLSNRINSKILKRTVSLFTSGLISGGHLARLLETTAIDIRETQELKKEFASSTKMYTIFIIFIIVIGIPLLLSISIQFLIMLSDIKSKAGPLYLQEFGKEFLMPGGTLDPTFVNQMGYLILGGTAFFVSILVGIINEGKFVYGIKYFIPLLLSSFVVFIILRTVVSGLLSALA
jgi:flagellar protein FlaJ